MLAGFSSSARVLVLPPGGHAAHVPRAVRTRHGARAHDVARSWIRSLGTLGSRSRRHASDGRPVFSQRGGTDRHHRRAGDPAEALARLDNGRTQTIAKLGADGCAALAARTTPADQARSTWPPSTRPAPAIRSTPAFCTPGCADPNCATVSATARPAARSRRGRSAGRRHRRLRTKSTRCFGHNRDHRRRIQHRHRAVRGHDVLRPGEVIRANERPRVARRKGSARRAGGRRARRARPRWSASSTKPTRLVPSLSRAAAGRVSRRAHRGPDPNMSGAPRGVRRHDRSAGAGA